MPETGSPRRPQGNDETRSVAAQYTAKAGIQAAPHDTYAPTNETTLKRIADFYENAKHEPENPEVQKAYRALAEETRAQYDEMVANGIEIEPYEGKGEPYANSAAMLADIRDNKHLYFFLTKNAFGEGADSGNNALLEKSGIKINGVDLLYNDLFRAVHDYFGHTAEGFEFGPRGEYNAYLAHSRMFSDEAKPALAAETLAQNAWVNFGPQLRRADGSLPKAGDADFVPIAKRRFADQKNTVVPPELLQAADPQAAFMPESGRYPEYTPDDLISKGRTGSGWIFPDGKSKFAGSYSAHDELAKQNGFGGIETARSKGALRVWLDGEEKVLTLSVDALSELTPTQERAVSRLARDYDVDVRLDTGARIPSASFMPEDSQLEGFGESMREKMRAKMAKVEPTGYEEGDKLELPSGKVVEFVSDLLPKKGGARDGAQMAYVRFEDGMESAVYADDLTKYYGPGATFMPEAQFDAPKKLPDAIGGRPIILVHRGNAGLSEIDPARFGKSGITPRSELAGAPRSYYYVKGLENKSDPVMGRGSKYEIPVSGKRIYDADTDNLDWTQQINRWKADDMLKAAGYVGLSRTRGTGKNKFQQVELFEKLKVPSEGRFMPEGRSVPEAKRKVEEAAIRFDGEIFTGAKHYDAFERMQEQGFVDEGATTDDVPSSAFGFVDNKGKFMTRVEAAKLAEASGQLSAEGIRKSIWNLPEGRALEADGFEMNRRFMPEVEALPNEELARGIDIDPTPANELNEGDAKIDWSAAFMPETIPGVFPLIDQKLLEQIKSETPTIAAIHIDRMRVGSYKGIELQGGMFYPAIKENVDKGVVWAFNSKNVASGVAKRAAANGGYVKLVLMAEGNVVGNKTFTNIWFNDVREAVASGDLKEKRALLELNRVRRNFASDTDHKTKWETLEQAQKDIVDMPQMLRSSTYFQKTKVVTKGDGEKVQYGSLLTKALTSVGFPDAVQLVSALEEPAFKGVPQGAAVAVVKFDPIKDKSEIKTAEEAGVPEHMSYKYVLKGRPVARLENYSVVDADYPEIRRLIMSQQKKDFPVGRALLPDVAAGQINYGLQDATVAPRRAAEAPLADEGVVSLPQRGLADATISPRNK
jgi:hypothetical protein